MGLGLLLIPAIGGYWFLTHWNYTRYRAARDSGYHVLFRSAFAGLVLFGLAYSIVLLLNHLTPQFGSRWDDYVPIPHSAPAALSVLLGFLLPIPLNWVYGAERAAQKAAKSSGDLVELLIAESIADQKPVELSLKSGKSYIGLALESGIERSGESDIALVPLASGYRDETTHELRITTYYSPVIGRALRRWKLTYEDFRIVIPKPEIVSARLFFPEAYRLFQRQRVGHVPESRTPDGP